MLLSPGRGARMVVAFEAGSREEFDAVQGSDSWQVRPALRNDDEAILPVHCSPRCTFYSSGAAECGGVSGG